MSCESLVIDGCETLVLEIEVPVILEVAEQGPPGPPGEEGPPGTTDYNDLINKPTLGTAAAKDIEFFATAAALSTTSSAVTSLSTSTSSGLSTATSRIASLSTGLGTANSVIASLSTSTASGLSTSTSRIDSLSTSTSTGLSTSASSIASLSTSTSSALSTTAVGLAGKVDTSAVGDSVAPLVAGLVPSIYLPSYVDDVLEFASLGNFPATGEAGKIYIALDSSRQYRWGGSAYTELLASPGTTDNVVEGVSNLYFTAARVRSAVLTGLAAGANAVIAATDSVIGAFQKLQAQISALVTTVAGKADTTAVNALDAQNVKITGDQSVSGNKSFSGVTSLSTVASFGNVSLPFCTFNPSVAVSNAGVFSLARGNMTGASGTQVSLQVAPTVAQSGTAGFIALDVAVTQNSVGSGTPLFQRWMLNSVTYASIRSNGHLSTRGLITAGSVDGLTTGTSYLNALGSFAMGPTTITADTTLGITHGSIVVNAPAGTPVTLTLPAASTCPGREYPIKRIDGSAGVVRVLPTGVELIDGVNGAWTLTRQYSAVTLRSTGSRWVVESSFEPLALSQQTPVINIMSDSGRGTVKANPLVRSVGVFNPSRIEAFLAANNGASAWTAVGQFYHDNSTNGGASAALTQPVIDLLAAMGRTGAAARYGVEFHVMERTAGAGTSLSAGGYPNNYLGTINGSTAMFGAGNVCTFTAWMRCIDNNQIVIARSPTWINGNLQTNVGVITPAMGWVHVRTVISSTIGYDNAAPQIYTEVGQTWQIALPGFFLGYVDPGRHLAPLQTINELIP